MGSGGSRHTNVETFVPSDVDLRQPNNNNPSAGGNNNVQNSVHHANSTNGWGSPKEAAKPGTTPGKGKSKETKNPLTLLGRAFGKGENKQAPRKIVDLDSSESDTDPEDFEESKKGIDFNLRNDIEDLENTFTRLGLDENGRVKQKNSKNILWNDDVNVRETGFSVSSGSDASTVDIDKYENRRKPVKKNLRFSWDDRPFIEKEDSWTLSKVQIDGFDPEKFRVANSTKPPDKPSVLVYQRTESLPENDVPGAVPSYDPLEQQLLASIEREMGVF